MGENTKPFAIAYREIKTKIIEVINESGLPLDAIDLILGEIKSVVHSQAETEYFTNMERIKGEENQSEVLNND